MSRQWVTHGAALGLFVAVAVVMTWPLVTVFTTRFAGHPFHDAYEYARHIWWIKHALQTGQPLFEQPLLAYPDGLNGALVWSYPLQSFPAWLFSFAMPLPAAFNLTLLLRLAFNGLAAYWLARSVTGAYAPALIGGLVFMAYPAVQGQIGAAHIGLLVLWPAPLFAYALLRMGERKGGPTRRSAPTMQPLTPRPSPTRGEGSKSGSPGYPIGAASVASDESGGPPHRAAPTTRFDSGEGVGVEGGGPTRRSARPMQPLARRPRRDLASTDTSCQSDESVTASGPPSATRREGSRDQTKRSHSSRWWVAMAALCVVASTWGSTQMLLFTIVPITVVFGLAWLAQGKWRLVAQTVAAFGLGGVIALVWAVPLLQDTLSQPAYTRVESNMVEYSADLFAIAAPSFYNPLYSGVALSRRILGVDPFEGAAYVGIAAGALALIGVFKARRAWLWLALAVISWVASLGPLLTANNAPVMVDVAGYSTYMTLPWAAVFNLPLVNITRTPARFNFTVGLAVAMLAAMGFALAWRRLGRHRWRGVLVPVALALIVADYQWFGGDMPTVPGVVPEPIAALSERDDIRAVFDVPWEHLVAAKEGMWLQTGHQQPLIAGHMTRVTPVDPAKLTILQATLNRALLDAAGVDVIILHKEWDDAEGALEARLRDALGAPLYEDERFAAFDVPDPANNEGDAPFLAIPAADGPIQSRVESYVYVPEAARLRVTATVRNEGRDLILIVDDQPGPGWRFDDTSMVEGWIEVSAGYHRLALVASPPCPNGPPPALACRAVELSELAITVDEADA